MLIEVTNTLQARSTTGYQRFVRAFVNELRAPGSPSFDVIPVVWEGRGYRRLTAGEETALAAPRVRVSAGTGGSWRHGPLLRPARACGRRLRAWRRRSLRLTVPAGAVFFDAEPAWHDPQPRALLLPELQALGVTVVTMVADVLPVERPEWFEPRVAAAFASWLQAHLAASDLVLAISEHTRAEVVARAERPVPVQVVPLGADFDEAVDPVPVPLPSGLDQVLLVVGTLEPRKNQALAIDLLDRLSPEHPDVGVVLVGKRGWLVDELAARIAAHPLQGSRLVWLAATSDAELAWLYHRAFLALVPSWSEGLGLPVLEALRAGVPTITSTGGALPEAGHGLTETAEPADLDSWERLVRRHLEVPAHHAAARRAVATFAPPTWRAAAQVVRDEVAAALVPEGAR